MLCASRLVGRASLARTLALYPSSSASPCDLARRVFLLLPLRSTSHLPPTGPPPEPSQPLPPPPLEAPARHDEGDVDPNDNSGEVAIYKGILSTQIKLVKGFSLMTSVIGLAFQPVLYYQAQTTPNVGLVVATGAFISFFTFATPFIIHFVSKKYVTALYYNKKDESYTAVTYSLFLRPKKLKFRLGDVQVPDIPGMFTTFKAHDTPLFVDGQQFFLPKHFGRIMGYDKPISLRWKGGPHDGVTESEYRAGRK